MEPGRAGSLPPMRATYAFVLGSRRQLSAKREQKLAAERARYPDILEVDARDYLPYAVAEKTLGWLRQAYRLFPRSAYIAKADDDTLVHVTNLMRDLFVAHVRLPSSYLYYGVMRYRLWDRSRPNGACGVRGEDCPPSRKTLRILRRELEPMEHCAGSAGPYLFTDGSLGVMSHRLLSLVATGEAAEQFASLSTRNANGTSAWLHEDAGIGYLVYNASQLHSLPISYVSLHAWHQNRYWVDLVGNEGGLPDNETMFVHRVKTLEVARVVTRCLLRRELMQPQFIEWNCSRGSNAWRWDRRPPRARCFTKIREKRLSVVRQSAFGSDITVGNASIRRPGQLILSLR